MSYIYLDEVPAAAEPSKPREGGYLRGGKRSLDISIVLLILPFVIPVLLIAWSVTFAQGGSGFYRQVRVGRHGRVFRCWKIRTMAADADEKLQEIIISNPHIALEWQTNQKLAADPRVTAFGRFLRASSIDELPQLWNVLRGDMSLIGPRPFTPDQRKLYEEVCPQPAYYALRPGISGPWQVHARNAGKFQDRVGYDEEYARSISLFNDLIIATRTVGVVLRATGK